MYRTYAPMVLRRCRFLLKDEAEALDIMQDVFIRILARKDAVDLSSPSSLLWNSATRLCLNRIRDKARRGISTSTDECLSQIADMKDERDEYETENSLFRLFEGEPASSRTMAVLHFVDGMTLEETARETGLSVSGVRKRLRALQAKLKGLEVEI